MRDQFWELPLTALNLSEWEALCDGCGTCCFNKLEDDKGEIYYTEVACDLLNLETGSCSCYPTRQKYVPLCIDLTIEDIPKLRWLPETCAYRLRYENAPLPEWHYLISGDRSLVRLVYPLDQSSYIHESEMKKGTTLEDYIIED